MNQTVEKLAYGMLLESGNPETVLQTLHDAWNKISFEEEEVQQSLLTTQKEINS